MVTRAYHQGRAPRHDVLALDGGRGSFEGVIARVAYPFAKLPEQYGAKRHQVRIMDWKR